MGGITGCGDGTGYGSATFSYKLNANCLGTATGNAGNDYNYVFNKTLTTGNIFLSNANYLLFGTIIKQ
jgi:hypothetical protein